MVAPLSAVAAQTPSPPGRGFASRPLTVVQLLPRLQAGGVECGTLETARALVAAGHRAVVVSETGRLVDELRAVGGEHIDWPVGRKSPTTLALLPRLRRLFRDRAVDIVHARSRVPAWLAHLTLGTMSRARRPRFLTTMHGIHSVSWYSEVMTRGEAVVAVSQAVRDHIAVAYPRCDLNRVTVVPNGVDHSRLPHGYMPSSQWRAAFDARYPETVGRKRVVIVGRLTRLKGYRDLFAVLSRLPHDWHAIVVGGANRDHQLTALHAEAERLAIGGRPRVTFTGHRCDVREIIAASSVLVSLSTRPESFGRTVLEALALGVPVVGYDHGGVGEILSALFPAGRVLVGDVVGVAERLQTIVDRNVRPQPVAGYDLHETCAHMLALYERLAAEAPADVGNAATDERVPSFRLAAA